MPYHLPYLVTLCSLAFISWDDPVQIAYQLSDHRYIVLRVALWDDFEITSIHSAHDCRSEEHSDVILCDHITHHILHLIRDGSQSSHNLYALCDFATLGIYVTNSERPHVPCDSAVNVAE
jgi:hypothetical protein